MKQKNVLEKFAKNTMMQDIIAMLIEFIGEDEIYEKQSDDGEPTGTAGAPILNILKKKELSNILVVVTRYFGGILLGTGGLVKAYSEAAISAIENRKRSKKRKGIFNGSYCFL